MKYSEFKEAVEKLDDDYVVEEHSNFLVVVDKDGEGAYDMLTVLKDSFKKVEIGECKVFFHNNYGDTSFDILKLAIELAETPLEEREDISYWLKLNNDYIFQSSDSNELIKGNGENNPFLKSVFTEKEIDNLKTHNPFVEWTKVEMIKAEVETLEVEE